MKRIEDIEMMDLGDLEAIADDSSVRVPDSLEPKLNCTIDSLDMVDGSARSIRRSRLIVRTVAVAACLQIFILGGIAISNKHNAPVDTFDSPELAYAQLEQTLMKMGSCINKGTAALEKGNEVAAMPGKMIDEIINR